MNPLAGIAHMLAHPFVRYAFLAGSAVAPAAGLAGYFLVLRAQVFTADALSHVAVAGAMAALAFGVDPRLGLFVATVGVAVGMGLLGPRGRPDDVVIGTVFAWILGLGVLFLTLYTRSRSTSNSTAGVTVLFGSVFGLSRSHALEAAVVSAGTVVVLLLIARPLLFATIDEAVARARGLPVTALGVAFLLLLGLAAAEASQITGSLLVFALLVVPAATAQLLTARPAVSIALSVGIAVAVTWLGLAAAYYSPYPIGFFVTTFGFALFALAEIATRLNSIRRLEGRLGPSRRRA